MIDLVEPSGETTPSESKGLEVLVHEEAHPVIPKERLHNR